MPDSNELRVAADFGTITIPSPGAILCLVSLTISLIILFALFLFTAFPIRLPTLIPTFEFLSIFATKTNMFLP